MEHCQRAYLILPVCRTTDVTVTRNLVCCNHLETLPVCRTTDVTVTRNLVCGNHLETYTFLILYKRLGLQHAISFRSRFRIIYNHHFTNGKDFKWRARNTLLHTANFFVLQVTVFSEVFLLQFNPPVFLPEAVMSYVATWWRPHIQYVHSSCSYLQVCCSSIAWKCNFTR